MQRRMLVLAAAGGVLLGCSDELRAGYDAKPISQPVLLDASAAPGPDRFSVPDGCTAPSEAVCGDEYCRIAPGCFLKGSEWSDLCRNDDEGRHVVRLTHALLIAAAEVTQQQFAERMGYNPAAARQCGSDCPVESVSWHEAAAYTNAISDSEGLTRCYSCSGAREAVRCRPAAAFAGASVYACPGYRLPTEAEWEYAYRARSQDDLYSGAASTCFGEDSTADEIGWYRANANNAPHRGRLKQPNAWQLYDMAGNVSEWNHDGYGPYPSVDTTDPVLAVNKDRHSYRGGSWLLHVKEMRAAHRSSAPAVQTDPGRGFRPVRSVP